MSQERPRMNAYVVEPVFGNIGTNKGLNRFSLRGKTKVQGQWQLFESELETYKTVINSAMFEHVLGRESLNHLNNLVDKDGCLIIHTVVCENVPNDPNWFYLVPPVHTAFHTNKSMEILMDQWGYRSSIYCPPSKCWVLLRDNIEDVKKKITVLNQELQSKWFYCKDGFVDYWKGF